MRRSLEKAAMLTGAAALSIALVSCGGDSNDDASPEASPVAATAAPNTVAAATAEATAAATADNSSPNTPVSGERLSVFPPQGQRVISNVCAWGVAAVAGTLDPEDPFADLFGGEPGDPAQLANDMAEGLYGKTLEQAGQSLADAVVAAGFAEAREVAGTDISAACESLGWTPT